MEATLASIVAAASPLIYAAIGETITEKAGVVNLSLEGSIMLSAMTGFAVAFVTGSALIGFLAAMAVGMLIVVVVAFASIELRLNQIAVGFVLTLLAIELSGFLGDPYVGQPGQQVPSLPIPLLSDIPFLGKVLFDHNLSVYGSYLAIVGAYLWVADQTFSKLVAAIEGFDVAKVNYQDVQRAAVFSAPAGVTE